MKPTVMLVTFLLLATLAAVAIAQAQAPVAQKQVETVIKPVQISASAFQSKAAGGFADFPPIKPVMTMDFETGDFSQWRARNSGGRATAKMEVVRKPTRAGSFAGKYTSDGYRSESASGYLELEEEYWITWSIFIPNSWPRQGIDATVTQIHGHNAKQKCMDHSSKIHIKAASDSWGIWVRDMTSNQKDKTTLAPLGKDRWTDLAIHAKFSKTNGFFTLWIDGKVVYRITNLLSALLVYNYLDLPPGWNCPVGLKEVNVRPNQGRLFLPWKCRCVQDSEPITGPKLGVADFPLAADGLLVRCSIVRAGRMGPCQNNLIRLS